MKLTLNPYTQNRRMRRPESSLNLSSVPPDRHFWVKVLLADSGRRTIGPQYVG